MTLFFCLSSRHFLSETRKRRESVMADVPVADSTRAIPGRQVKQRRGRIEGNPGHTSSHVLLQTHENEKTGKRSLIFLPSLSLFLSASRFPCLMLITNWHLCLILLSSSSHYTLFHSKAKTEMANFVSLSLSFPESRHRP